MGRHDEAMEEGSSDRDFRELKNVTDAFVRAICTNDASRIAELLSEDWVLVTPEVGPIAREQFLGAIKDGRLRRDTMDIDVVRVRIYDDTALAAIVEAICKGDAQRAGDLARKHIRGSRTNILRLLEAKSDFQSFMARAS